MRKLKRTTLSFDEWLSLLPIRFQPKGSVEDLKLALTELEKFCSPLGAKESRVALREIERIASGCLLCAKQHRSLLPRGHARQELRRAGELLRKGRAKIIKNWGLTLAVQEQYDGSPAEFSQKLTAVDELIRMTRSAADRKGEPSLTHFGFRPSSPPKFYTLLQCYCLLRTLAADRKLGLTKNTGPLVWFTDAVYRYATGEKKDVISFSRSLDELHQVLPEVEKLLAATRPDSAGRQAKPEPKNGRPPRRRPSLAQNQRVRPRARGVGRMGLDHTRTGRLRGRARSRSKQLPFTPPATP
jgi:hypothetical protein